MTSPLSSFKYTPKKLKSFDLSLIDRSLLHDIKITSEEIV